MHLMRRRKTKEYEQLKSEFVQQKMGFQREIADVPELEHKTKGIKHSKV